MIQRSSHNSAVSSVVGVILMVALTVVLAAVLGQFVFDLVGVLKKPPQAGVTFKVDQNDADPTKYDVTVITTAMPNADRVVVRPSSGPGMQFDEVGDSQRETYDQGTTLTVLAEKGSDAVVVQVYTVGET